MNSRAGRNPASYAAITLAFAIALLLWLAGPITPAAKAAGSPAVVSLTFDDSDLDQFTNALPLLQQYGMHGTFYVITGYIGVNSGYMTLPQLQEIAADGNEIAGHTVEHPHMTSISADEATRQACDSRNTLLSWGFPVTDFAYPYSDANSSVEDIVQHCGYNSGRLDENLLGPHSCLSGCPATSPIPPSDPYGIPTPSSIKDDWTLSDLENLVTGAEAKGGWLPLTFHHICDNDCNPYSVTPELLNSFLAWLQTQNVQVKTVNQVIGGPVNPPVSAPEVQPPAPGTNGAPNPSLETGDSLNPGFPDCWRASNSGDNTATYSETASAHTGSVAETVSISSFTSGAARLISRQDLGQCAPGAAAGHTYVASAFYTATTPARFAVWYRDTLGGWHFWAQSPMFAPSSSWTQATWATPAVPAGATALSFGMEIEATGSLTTDDYSLADSGGGPTTPSVSLTGPSAGSTLTGQTTFTATASSSLGISRVDFLVNGAVVATSTSPPYTATWDSASVGDGPVTLTARATDIGGSQATSSGTAATVSNAAQRGGNLLANSSLESSANGSTPDCWQLGGSGTNTFAWTRTATAHAGSWGENVAITAYTSGDRKLVTSQGANACSPRVTPGSTYNLGGWYQSDQPAHITAYYKNASGSWVFWTQSPVFAATSGWAHATWTTPAVPDGATAVSFGINLSAVGSLTTDDYSMTGN
jgi:peptidoglycan/xylan/chitin deacetylase (PgdA/CDA1 family)